MRKTGLLIFFCFALISSASAQFTFECFCGYLTAADSNCDVCTSGQQSRYFKGLLIRKDGVVHKWIEQPYTILQNFDALTFKELIPGAEQIRITLAGTSFDSIQQFRDSVMCPCSGGAGVLVIEAGPGINIYGDTIASIPQQIDTFDLVSGTADTIRISLTRDSVPFHFVILPPDSDNQYIDTLRLTGTTLEISLFGDNIPLSTVDLSSLVADGSETIVTGTNGITVTGTGTSGNPYVVGMPAGTNTQTLRHNGTAWIANSLLRNDGADVGINTAPSATALLKIKQTTDTDGIAIERSSDTKQLQLQQGSDAIVQSTAGNLFIKATSGQLLLYGPGGGGFINQIDVAAQSAVTSNFGNGALLRLSATYAPTAAGGDFGFLKFLPVINQTGAADQDIYFLDFVPTITASTGTIHGIRYYPSIGRFLWQPNGAGVVVNHLAGNTGIGSGSTTPAQTLHVQGTARVTGSDGTPTSVVGRDVDGDISALGLSGLTITAGTLTVTADGDGSSTNEGVLGVSAGGANDALLTSNTSGAVGVTYSGGTGITVSESTSANGGTITITNAGDLSATNELQTLANTSDATSHTTTLSNSGGSVKLVEGSGVTIATTGTGLDGIATITATDASTTNEIQTISASGAGPTSYNIDLSLSGGTVTLTEGAGINLTRTSNDITIASTVTDTDDQNLTIEGTGPTYNIAIDNGTDVTISGAGIITLSESPANTLVITGTEVDGSVSNELQTLANTSAATTHTVTLSNSGGSVQFAEGSGVSLTTTGTGLDGIVTVANTGDLSATNEAWIVDADDADTELITTQTVKFQGGGIVVTDYIPGTDILTITGTEVDGSTSNELQTLANTSSATTHTATLSNGGGSIQLVEGANVTLTTTGTGLDGIVTIAATSGSGTDLSFSGAGSPVTLVSNTGTDVTITAGTGISLSATGTDITITNTVVNTDAQNLTIEGAGPTYDVAISGGTDVTIQGGGIVTLSESPANTLIVTATEVDGSVTNEAWTVDANAGDTEVISNQTLLFSGAGIATTSYSSAANTVTITATEVDGSTSNELQTLANTSAATTHTVTLSNSGGSVQLAEGTGVTLTTTGTGLDGVVTIANTGDLSATNEAWTIDGDDADTELITTQTVKFQGGGIVITDYITGTDILTITATEVDGSTTNEAWTIDADDADTEVIGNQTVKFQGAGITTTDYNPATDVLLVTSTEVDGSVSNELQTLTNTSNATTHTVTLSNSGGSVQLAEGTNVTLTTTGTGLDGVVTIAAASGPGTDLSFSGASSPVTLNSSTGTDVTFTQGGIVTISATSGNITITGTEVDGSTSNELQTLANTSTSTTHVATLSNSGGSVTMSEGSGITIATTGTGLDGIATITAVDPSLSNEGSLTVNAGTGSTSVISSNTAGSTDVTITAGAGLSISEVGNVITLANTGDLSTTNELQTLANTSNATTHTVTLSNSGGSIQFAEGSGIALATTGTGLDGIVTVSSTITDAQNLTIEGAGPTYDVAISGGTDVTISGAGIITLSESPANTLILTGTEVDGSVTNEGTLGVSAGSGTSSVITSNTSGATGVTVNAAGILTISESTSANGGSITLTATEVDGSTSNELQTLANTSAATTHTVTLSNSGGSVQLVEGAGILLATTGTGLDGIVTVSADPTAGLNGIYGDGTTGSGSDILPPGGSNVEIPGQNQALSFELNTTTGQVWTALKVTTPYSSDDAFSRYLVGKAPADSLEIYNYDGGTVIKETGGVLTIETDKEAMIIADSVRIVTIPTRTVLPFIVGQEAGGYLQKIEGTATGEILTWDEPNGYWEISAAPGVGISGTGAAGQSTFWTGTSTVSGDNAYWWDNTNKRLGLGVSAGTPSAQLEARTNSLGTTQTTTAGAALTNTTAAAAGVQQISPALRWTGQGWKTNATAASQSVEFRAYATPVQGTTAPTGYLGFGSAINGSWTNDQFNINSSGDVAIGTTTFTPGRLNISAVTGIAPMTFNAYGTSTSGGIVYGVLSNTLNTASTIFSLNEESTSFGTLRAGLRKFGSAHATRPNELNLTTFVASAPVTIGTNDAVRLTVAADGTVHAHNKLAGGFASTTGVHSTVQSAGSVAAARLETVGAPTFDATKHEVIYTASTNITWTLPTAGACACDGRVYILHHAGTAGTITLSQTITKGNAGNFNTLTAGQWAYITYGASTIRGYKLTSL